MPKGDPADSLTPAERRRRHGSGVLIFSLFLAAVLAALAATVLFVNDGRNFRRLMRQFGIEYQPTASDVTVAMPVVAAGIAASYPSRLVQHDDGFATALIRDGRFFTARRACEELRSPRSAELNFSDRDREWECLHLEHYGEAAEPGSLFLHARGRDANAIGSFRLKLSLTDPATEQEITQAALSAVERFGVSIRPETRAYLSEMLNTRTAFSAVIENYRMKFTPEVSDPRRHNFMIIPREPAAACDSGLSPAENETLRYFPQSVDCLRDLSSLK